MSQAKREEDAPLSSEEADQRSHSREVWGRHERQAPILKGFQSELGGRLSGATKGSSYAIQVGLAYNDRYGDEQAVQDALFKRHFDWRQVVPVAVVGVLAVLYYAYPSEVNQGFGWLRDNILFTLVIVGLFGLAAKSVLDRREKKQ